LSLAHVCPASGPPPCWALVVTVDLTWIMVSILLGGLSSGFPHIQKLFTSEYGTLSCSAVEVTRVASQILSFSLYFLCPSPPLTCALYL
uniref:Uncharacterized protein n=1 Tax=Panthera leo TaxID=9689 RepID=A0A8C9D466_PANLE